MNEYLLNKAYKLEKILEEIESTYEEAKEKSSILDQIRNDILHEIELDNLDAIAMTRKFKELKATLKLRRKYKDNVNYLIKFRQNLNLKMSKKTIASIKGLEKQLDKRKYSNRIESSIRKEILNEVENI